MCIGSQTLSFYVLEKCLVEQIALLLGLGVWVCAAFFELEMLWIESIVVNIAVVNPNGANHQDFKSILIVFVVFF